MTSRRNINPKLWGPPAWRFLDMVVMSYPDVADLNDQVSMSAFVESLVYALPCALCRNNTMSFIQSHPPMAYMSGRLSLQRWFLLLKNNSKR